jgi:hypothetical protein
MFVIHKHDKKSNKDYAVLEDIVFCTIEHQKDYVKESMTDNLTWLNDGAGGKDDPRSSNFSRLST